MAQRAERVVAESVQPFLASLLEEIMGPVSSGFSAVRELFEREVDALSQSFQASADGAQLREVRAPLSCEVRPWLLPPPSPPRPSCLPHAACLPQPPAPHFPLGLHCTPQPRHPHGENGREPP